MPVGLQEVVDLVRAIIRILRIRPPQVATQELLVLVLDPDVRRRVRIKPAINRPDAIATRFCEPVFFDSHLAEIMHAAKQHATFLDGGPFPRQQIEINQLVRSLVRLDKVVL